MSTVGFEWTIRAGDVLTMLGALSVAAGLLYRRGRDESSQEGLVEQALDELKEVKEELKKLTIIAQDMAVMKVQVGLLMKWYDELRHGDGYVQNRPQRGKLDSEFP